MELQIQEADNLPCLQKQDCDVIHLELLVRSGLTPAATESQNLWNPLMEPKEKIIGISSLQQVGQKCR